VQHLSTYVDGFNIRHDVKVVNMSRTRKPYHHGDLKRALIDAALALVVEKGSKGFTLSEAARRAGVSVAAPYRHFADKADLLAAVAEQGFVDLHGALIDANTSSDPKEVVIDLSQTYVHWAVTHPDYYQVMFGGDTSKAVHPGLVSTGKAAFDELLHAVIRCQQAGWLPTPDPMEVAGTIWTLAHGIASLSISGDMRHVGIKEDPETLITRVVTASLQAGQAG
jgi:AcrR family transcriptional regulator